METNESLDSIRVVSTENTINGVNTTLHYPIVTEPRRKSKIVGYNEGFGGTLRRGYSTIQVRFILIRKCCLIIFVENIYYVKIPF